MTSSITRSAYALAIALACAAPPGRAGRVGADGRHDGRRHAGHHRQPGPGVRGLPLRRLQPLRLAGAVGSVAQRQGVRHQAGPRHRVAGRSQRHALDLQAAPGRQVARRLRLHRRRRGLELRPTSPTRRRRSSTRRSSPRRAPIITNFASVSRRSTTTPSRSPPRCRTRCSRTDQLRADGQPVPRQGGATTTGTPMPSSRPAPVRTNSTRRCRISAWSCCRTRNTGTRSACRSRTGWC